MLREISGPRIASAVNRGAPARDGSRQDHASPEAQQALPLGWSFAKIPLVVGRPSVEALATQVQTKRGDVSSPTDVAEREADDVARRVMLMPSNASGMPGHPAPVVETGAGSRGGDLLPGSVRSFFEPRFGCDFSAVRVHSDGEAARMSRALNAQAFTHRQHIYFGPGRSPGQDALTAHELTHVLQQTGSSAAGLVQNQSAASSIQRVVEVRPPGRGEASAFDRRQELIDRLNAQSAAIQYHLDGRVLRYDVVDEGALTNFDRQMQRFIDRAEVVPMRLITSEGRVGDPAGPLQPLQADSFVLAYVDLDDMLASDDLGFQTRLVHLLAERFAARNYDRRIGTAFTLAEFNRAHGIAREAEAEVFQGALGDPTIRFLYEEVRPNGTMVRAFRSDEGYHIFKIVRGAGRPVQGAEVSVQTRDRRRLTIDEFRAERGAAVPAP